MKRVFITLAIICVMISGSAFANDEIISKNIIHSFQTMFTEAKEVSWSRVNDLYVANFKLKGQQTAAYYNAQGTVVATGSLRKQPANSDYTIGKPALKR